MCVFMYKGIITLSMLSFLQYEFEAKLYLGVRGGNLVNYVERIITVEAGRAVRPLNMRFS